MMISSSLKVVQIVDYQLLLCPLETSSFHPAVCPGFWRGHLRTLEGDVLEIGGFIGFLHSVKFKVMRGEKKVPEFTLVVEL